VDRRKTLLTVWLTEMTGTDNLWAANVYEQQGGR